MSAAEHLATYLNDHLAGAATGVEMARRLAEETRHEPDGPDLARIAEAIEEDRETLRGLVEKLGVSQNPVKQAVGWVAERAHRLGVSETLTRNPALTRMLKAETLSLGIEGKHGLWLALREVISAHPELGDVDLPGLVERARQQRERVEAYRLAMARRAFTEG
jgi:hypothetical protein